MTTEEELTDLQLQTTPVGFAITVLGLPLYPWQAEVLTWYEPALNELVMGTLCTPNGAGKDAIIIATLALWWVSVHKRGTVVITSADARQIDEQTYPAMSKHQGKFQGWRFLERYIETATKGRIIFFTTDSAGKAEGWHRDVFPETLLPDPDGPLLMIVNEAKSVAEEIFTATDRCTYNAILLASSPGSMHGCFYDSHTRAKELGYRAKKVGLLECPHITPDKIKRIIAKHGPNSPKTQSMLHGNFMLADGDVKFDQDGLDHLNSMSLEGYHKAKIGRLELSNDKQSVNFVTDPDGWVWVDESPIPGTRVLISCDPNSGEQAEGTLERDNTACCVLREAYKNEDQIDFKTAVVAALHWPGGVKWDSDILAERMAILSKYYGNCMVAIEANNFGSAVIKTMQLSHPFVPLYRRQKPDDVNPNKILKIVGYLTGKNTRDPWVEACNTVTRDKSLICRYRPATDEFQTFIELASGRCEAIQGKHDDWVAAIGIGLVVRCWTTIPRPRVVDFSRQNRQSTPSHAMSQWGEGAFG